MATNQTSEGKTTAFYLIDIIENKDIKITQPAQGVPLGSELDYIDEATLKTAFNARFNF